MAMQKQATATHGLSRSPMRANFQNRPLNLRSVVEGRRRLHRPVHIQMGDQQRCCRRVAPPPTTAAAAAAGRSPGALVEQARGCSRWGAGEQAGGEQGPAGEGCRPSGAPHASAPLPLTYVQVQMVSSSTTRKDEKEKRALMGQGRRARVGRAGGAGRGSMAVLGDCRTLPGAPRRASARC